MLDHRSRIVVPAWLICVAVTVGYSARVAHGANKPATAPTAADAAKNEQFLRRIQSYGNLKKISTELILWAVDHGGKCPPDLVTLAMVPDLDLATFVAPVPGSCLPKNYKSMGPADRAKWVNAHSDYVYLVSNAWQTGLDPAKPVIYEKDDVNGNLGMAVMFGDMRVDFLTMAQVHERLGPDAGKERKTTRIPPGPGQISIPLINMIQANAIIARAEMGTLGVAIEIFQNDNGRYPTTKEGLHALVEKPAGSLPKWKQCLDKELMDPWGRPFIYVGPEADRPFEVFSAGPDGKAGTSDDVRQE